MKAPAVNMKKDKANDIKWRCQFLNSSGGYDAMEHLLV